LGPAVDGRLPDALEAEIRRIYKRSPVYGTRFPIHTEPLKWSCYGEIPTLSKREIVERGHTAFFADYSEVERGTAGQALRVREHFGDYGGADDP
jgi:phenylacetate-CoA ligase